MSQPATRNLGRLSEIAQVAVRHGFGYWFDTHRLTDLFPRRGPRMELDGQPSQRGQHLREMLDELGPTFVKFGQLLSTRPDILPADIIAELRSLQDDVRPYPFAQVEQVVEEELGLTLDKLFSEFEERPVAAASIGQVHRATLPNGKSVAVKVQRPGAPRQIEADLALLYQASRIAKERVRALDFIDAHALVDEFARSIKQELDYRLEGRNAETFRHNFAGHAHVRIPKVYWSYSRSRVLTLELLEGVQLADVDLEAYTLDERRRLAYLLAETWMTMIFRHGFFHGDPHPANVFVLGPGQIGLVDFGQVGKLTDEDMSKLTRLFIDAANEQIKAIATLGAVGVDLYPDFNVFEIAKPYARNLLVERYTPRRVLARARKEGRELARVAASMPYQVHDFLEEVRDGQIEVGFVHKGLDEFMQKLNVAINRLVMALVVTGGLIGSSLIGIFAKGGPHVLGLHIVSVLGFVASGTLGLWLLWG